jgi:hypothetical protein
MNSHSQPSGKQPTSAELEFAYRPKLGPVIAFTAFILGCLVFMANVAIHNDQGLIIDAFINLDTAGATGFYWLVAACCLWPLGVGVNAMRLSLQKDRHIVLSEKNLAIPGVLPGAPATIVPFNEMTGLSLIENRRSRTLVVRHGSTRHTLHERHFADKASFERFLSHLHVEAYVSNHPAVKAALSSKGDSAQDEPNTSQIKEQNVREDPADDDNERKTYIERIRTADVLDAVFLITYYNSSVRMVGPRSRPALEVSQVLPELSQTHYELAQARVDRMLRAADDVGLAYYQYPEAGHSLEEAVTLFEAGNPGFGKESYGLAVNAAYVKFR